MVAARIQAARRLQEERRSEASRAAEDAALTAVARQAEKNRLQREVHSQQTAGSDQQWVAWTPVTFDLDAASGAAASPARPAKASAAPEMPPETLFTMPEEQAENDPAERPAREKRGFLGLFGRKKQKKVRDPEREAIPASAPIPQPQPEPVPEPEPIVAPPPQPEPPPVRLNVKPISWPAPPPPSRKFVHPPQHTVSFAPITPEQLRQPQAAQPVQNTRAPQQAQPVQNTQAPQQAQPVQNAQPARQPQARQPAAAPHSAPQQWQPAQPADGQKGAFAAPGRSAIEYPETAQKTLPPQKGMPTPYWQE